MVDDYLAGLTVIKLLGNNFVIGLWGSYIFHNSSIFCVKAVGSLPSNPHGFFKSSVSQKTNFCVCFFFTLSFFSFSKHPDNYTNKTQKTNCQNTTGTVQQKVLQAYLWYTEVSGSVSESLRLKGWTKGMLAFYHKVKT